MDQEEPYGFMERELAFKLLASHALVDPGFFLRLRSNPEAAAAELHIQLTDDDVDYLANIVEWDRVHGHADDVRASLHLDKVTHSW
jgi:hypothetical protein